MRNYKVIVLVKGKLYALFDIKAKQFVLDRVPPDVIIDKMLELLKPQLLTELLGASSDIDYERAQVLAGIIRCYNCTGPLTESDYNSSLPTTRQWCQKCLKGL